MIATKPQLLLALFNRHKQVKRRWSVGVVIIHSRACMKWLDHTLLHVSYKPFQSKFYMLLGWFFLPPPPPPPHSKFKDDFQSRFYMLLGSCFCVFFPLKFKDENVIQYSPAHRMTRHVWCMYAIASQFRPRHVWCMYAIASQFRWQSTAISSMQFICVCIATNSHMDEAVSPCYSGNLLPGILSVRESLTRSMLIRESLARYCPC